MNFFVLSQKCSCFIPNTGNIIMLVSLFFINSGHDCYLIFTGKLLSLIHISIAGSYRSVDFALSNMSNSHIQSVAVLTQYNSRSLNEHLSSSKWWDFGRKQGGMYVFTPTITAESSDWYRGTADALYQNLDFLKKSHEPYVVIAGGDCVYKLDYGKVLELSLIHI